MHRIGQENLPKTSFKMMSKRRRPMSPFSLLFYIPLIFPFISFLQHIQSISAAEHFLPRYGAPRFKQNARMHQFAYLGDTIRLKCNAIGRPQPKVHWYRNGQYLNYSHLSAHPRLKEKGMTLEVRRIEVGDRGNWTCRVWNNEGSTSRNFTLHVVDFCDYFLNVHIHPRRVPEECLCQWAIQQRDSLVAHHLRALPQIRADLDLTEFLQNPEKCQKYAQLEEIARLRTQPRKEAEGEETKLGGELFGSTTPATPATTRTRSTPKSTINPLKSTITSQTHTNSESTRKWRPTLKNLSAKIQLAKKIVKGAKKAEGRKEEDEDEDEDEAEEVMWKGKKPSTRTTIMMTVSSSSTRPWTTSTIPSRTTTAQTHWAIARQQQQQRWSSFVQRVPPYFRQSEENVQTNIVIPAGRTLKLACKAGGQPEPQVVWRKGNDEILRDITESPTGSLYQLRKWSLELEDAAELDSGEYVCEVFNSAGSINRKFHVEVQDRIRSRPILVPNVLQNQTIDVNGTVNFTCQVISDLVPHVIWIKLIRQNGSFLRWEPKEQRQTLNFLDLSTLEPRARIFHDEETNQYTMELSNVTMEDQGIYSCVAGNTLGLSMANATLTVNEFRSLTLPTEVPVSWPLSYTVLLILSFLLLCAFIALCMLYLFFAKKFSAKNRIQTLDKMAVRKKVVITKKPHREGEHWSDLASSYSITVEPVPVLGREGRGKQQRASTGDTVPLMGGSRDDHFAQNAIESSLLSDYEVPTDMAWEIERDRLQLVDILGEGAFGEVWRGLLAPKTEDSTTEALLVAVKRLKPAAQERELIILVSEMQILKSIGYHPNILGLIGCCTGLGPLLVILELCEHGNLRDFLRKHRPKDSAAVDDDGEEGDSEPSEEEEEDEEDGGGEGGDGREGTSSSQMIIGGRKRRRREERRQQRVMYQNVDRMMVDNDGQGGGGTLRRPLTLRDLVQFATEISRGMDFLASKKIIHRDLAARNVLVSRDLSMKISDFGLSRNVFYHDYYRKRGAGRLPIKWMAPEALEANVYTVNSDVWSFGILLWEIMTLGGTPYPSIAMPQLYNLLKEGYRMEPPHNCPEEIYGVMVSCWQEKPETRPSFRTIGDYFEWILGEAEKSDTSRSDTENGGETTDEGQYAVIPPPEGSQEGQQSTEANGGAQNGGADEEEAGGGGGGGGREHGGDGDEKEKKPTTPQRPMSAPGMMSFEVFKRDVAPSMTGTSESGSQQTPDYIRMPPLPPTSATRRRTLAEAEEGMDMGMGMRPEQKRRRRSLLEQLKEAVWRGSEKDKMDREKAEMKLTELEEAEEEAEAAAKLREEREKLQGPIYKNVQQQNPTSPPASSSVFSSSNGVNAFVHHQQQQPGPSSSSLECFTPPGDADQKPPLKPKKKSIASDHGLRVQGVTLFTGIGQQNAKMLGGANALGSAISSASFGGGSRPSPPNTNSFHGKMASVDWRSRSMDSSSSGHGGSSAMSSADALLGAATKEEEANGEESPPVGQTVDYITIAPIGQFPA